MFRLDEKLARIRSGQYTRRDFIIADAKDPDMGPGLHAVGPSSSPTARSKRFRTRAEFLDQVAAIVEQDIVDIMLDLGLEPGAAGRARRVPGQPASSRRSAPTTPPTSGVHRGAQSPQSAVAAVPHRLAAAAMYGTPTPPVPAARSALTDLGLYSITFNNDLDADVARSKRSHEFRADAAANELPLFPRSVQPQRRCGPIAPRTCCRITSTTASCAAWPAWWRRERPRFLKIAYNGPRALEELASFDPEPGGRRARRRRPAPRAIVSS